MLNNVVLVGRIVEEPTLKSFEGDFKGTFITLAVNRPFKNYENQVETDFIKVILWEGIAENVCNYCRKGDIIGIRGRLSTKKIEVISSNTGEPISISTIDVVGERISFISAVKRKTKEEVEKEYVE